MLRSLGEMFRRRVEASFDRPAQRLRQGDRWGEVTWGQVAQEVEEVAWGLAALGRRRGEMVGLLSQSRAEWVRADLAILSLGAVTVPIYPSYPEESIGYIVRDADLRTLVVEDRGHLDKVARVAGELPGLESVVVIGEGTDRPPDLGTLRVVSWAELRAIGRGARESGAAAVADALRDVGPSDVATVVYTSGTTGHPKGVVQTHGNLLAMLAPLAGVVGLRAGDVHLLFLPLAHSLGRLEALIAVHEGLVTAFAEGVDRLPDNLREVRPDFICSVPRVFEKVHSRIVGGVAAASPVQRAVFRWAVGVGRRAARRRTARGGLPASPGLSHRVARRLVFDKIQAAFGGRLRVCFSGGAPLSPEIAEFFEAVGILILEGYGLTETCPILTANRPEAYRFGTVGRAYPGVELRLDADGEIMARGPNIARGYFQRPEETAAVFGADGWFRTGDIGEIDREGFLRITDRKKDLIKTAGGSYVAPQHVEGLLKADPLVSHALVHGDRRPYPVALITLVPEGLARLAGASGLAGRPASEMVTAAPVQARVQAIVDAANAQLASYARVKRFAILPSDFTQESGELTPTLKLRRREIDRKYQAVLDGLYQDAGRATGTGSPA